MIGRAAAVFSCAAALVLTGCGTEVSGRGSLGGPPAGPGDTVGGSPAAGQPADAGQPAGAGPATGVVPPPAGVAVDYQIGGAYPPAAEVGVVIRDRSADPVSGVYSVCYINAFQAQDQERSRWSGPDADLLLRDSGGAVIEDDDWDEPLLDITTASKRARLVEIVDGWMVDCATRGFRAVELDNLDSWTRSSGRVTRDHAVGYAAGLVERAHARGLAVAQKNAAELTDEEIRRIGFDFAVAEDCQHYSWGRLTECDRYLQVYGDRVIEIEYTDLGTGAFDAACRARGDRVSILLRDRAVSPRGDRGYVSRSC